LLGIRVNGVGVFCGIIDWEYEFFHFSFVEAEESDFGGIRGPPEGVVVGEDFFFINPIRYAMEDGGVALGCDANG